MLSHACIRIHYVVYSYTVNVYVNVVSVAYAVNIFYAKATKKKTLFYGQRDSKKRSVGRHKFFKKIFFYILLPKLPEKSLKILIFSCSLRSQLFIQIFVQKTADFTIFLLKKKNQQMGKKRSVGPVEQVFFPLGLMFRILIPLLYIEHFKII